MARIPDRHALGRTPTPRPTRGVANYGGLANATAGAAASAGQGMQSLAQGVNKIAEVQQHIQTRDAHVRRVKAVSDLQLKLDERLRAAREGQDMSDPNVGKTFYKDVDEVASGVVSNFDGPPDVKAALQSQIYQATMRYKQNYSSMAVKAREAVGTKHYQEQLNTSSNSVQDNPLLLDDELDNMKTVVDNVAPIFGTGKDIANLQHAQQTVTMAAIDGRLMRNNPEEAEEILNRPDVQKILGSTQVGKYRREIAKLNNTENKYVREIQGKLAAWNIGNGRPANAPVPREVSQRIAQSVTRIGETTNKPNFINFVSGDGSQRVMVDISQPEGAMRARRLGASGFVRMGLMAQGGTPGDILGSDKRRAREWEAEQTSAGAALQTVDRIKQQIIQGGAEQLSFTGGAAKAIDTFANQAMAIGKFFNGSAEIDGRDADDSALLARQESYDWGVFKGSKVGAIAENSAAFRANVLGLAYSLARASDPGGRLSDKDVQHQINRIAADSGSPQQIAAALGEVERGIVQSIQTKSKVSGLPITKGMRDIISQRTGAKKKAAPTGLPPDAVPVEKNGKTYYWSPGARKFYVEEPEAK